MEKSDVLPWIRNSYITHVISTKAHILLINMSCKFVVKQRFKVNMMSVFFKMTKENAEYFMVKLNLFEGLHPKVCKKKNPICVLGKLRLICPLGHCLASQGGPPLNAKL